MRLRKTALPKRPEVTNPACHGPEFSSGIAFNIRSLPRCVIPFRFTRSYSRRCVRRRVFGNENELTFVVPVATAFIYPGTSCRKRQSRFVIPPSVQKKSSTENRRKTSKKRNSSLIAQATQPGTRQVFPPCQLAHQCWQREPPLKRDWLLQSWQAAGLWESDLSQERQSQFFARTLRQGRPRPECRCISS